MKKITFQTSDGVSIVGNWWDAGTEKNALLLHMMPATKESWIPLAEKLVEQNVNVLAIDFRGHGESKGGDYKQFSNEEHQKYLIDAVTAINYIQKYQNNPCPDLVLAGASIGASVSLVCAIENTWIEKLALLSPGENYKGIDLIGRAKLAQLWGFNSDILFVSSKDDGDNNEQTNRLKEYYGGTKITYETGGHGTDMWHTHPELLNIIVEFLSNTDTKSNIHDKQSMG